jgi:hypothetical protein
MSRTVSSVLVCLSFVSALVLATPAAAQTSKKVAITTVHMLAAVPVNGTTAAGGTFVGTLDLARFAIKNNELVALGTLNGTIKDSAGATVGMVRNAVAEVMVPTASGSCSILHLVLGPVDLDLLGLQVHLNRVVLDITAVPGPGNLLGNLLCQIADLLDAQSPLSILTNALNGLLRIVN